MAKSPLDDQFDREDFYRGPDPEADEVDDYELEPPDEDIIAGEQRRAQEVVEHASKAVDVDELYREPATLDAEDLKKQFQKFRLRFTTRHLLIAMTALAVALVVGRSVIGGFAPLLLVLTFLTLASAYAYVSWQEYQQQQEWEQRREELYRQNQDRHRQKACDDQSQPRP